MDIRNLGTLVTVLRTEQRLVSLVPRLLYGSNRTVLAGRVGSPQPGAGRTGWPG